MRFWPKLKVETLADKVTSVGKQNLVREREIRSVVEEMIRKTDACNNPNINGLWWALKDIDSLKINMKNMGYSLARQLQSALPPPPTTAPRRLGHSSRPSRQSEIEAEWFAHWCAELKIPVAYHRKLWELGFVLQSIYDADLLCEGTKAIGFGCGEEPIASYLAAKGVRVTVTDLDPAKVAGLGWAETGQHTDTLSKAWHPTLVERATFDANVSLRHVDMTDLPSDLQGYDLCWSICALEHLGSIRKGMDFIKNSLRAVRPGGLVIHTTEYNYLSKDETIDDWQTVLFLRKHFELLESELKSDGHQVAALNFDVGDGPLDKFVDLPPYALGEAWLSKEQWGGGSSPYGVNQSAHLKLSIDGYPSTCFGLVVWRGD